ncbi:hypothetical protein WKI13_01590 [Teredinibacter turnerae]|uniref:hypothetical protein n=1 Tax=Teredinibacter turnerae TaxID=2426 RepID=UPI00036EEEB2|nr:hypothetical protein [Teredinibacter turnerae]
MTDSKTQRKLMLLFHRVSSLKDKTLAAGTIAVSKGADSAWVLRSPGGFEEVIIGVRAFEEYARGRSFKPATLQHLNAITPKLFPGDWPTSEPLSNSHAMPVFRFGEMLGLCRAESRHLLDTMHAANFPLIRSLSSEHYKAKNFAQRYAGCYSLYRYDVNPAVDKARFPSGLLVKSTLTIRYPVPHKAYAYDANSRSSIRVKLNLPSYREQGVQLYKYDGLMGFSSKDQWWTWIFQGRFGDRNRKIEDLILMYTRDFDKAADAVATGTLLTQNQDNKSTPTPSDVVLIREPGYALTATTGIAGDEYFSLQPDEDNFMRNAPALIDMAQPDSWTDTDKLAISRLLLLK